MLQVDSYLTLKQAAARLGVHPNTLRNWERAGQIRLQRLPGGRHRRVPIGEVERILRQMRASEAPGSGVRLDPPDPTAMTEGQALARVVKEELAAMPADGCLEGLMLAIRGRSWSR